jgi:hypothetical protein
MIADEHDSKKCHGAGGTGLSTRLRCSRCTYAVEHPGPVTVGDLDRECGLCRAPLGAVTVFRVSETGARGGGVTEYRVAPHGGGDQ